MTIAVAAVVLAAGESVRMGTQKALLEWEGVPLIEYQLAQLEAVEAVRQIVVVTGHEPDRVRAIAASHSSASVVQNDAWRSGKATSVVAGLRALRHDADAIMVLAVDQPRSADVLRTMVEAHDAAGTAISVPVHTGRRGHPTMFARALIPELVAIRDETQGLRAVLRAHAGEIHEVECDESVLLDLNAPSDVEAAARGEPWRAG